MPRFYLPPGECEGSRLWLKEGEARHAVQVLRLREGDNVTVLDGAGNIYTCQIQKTSKREVELSVTGKDTAERPACEITLAQAVPKGKLFESIIQKATELGVARIIPLLTERVVSRADDHKGAKWQTVAIEAIKQCGSPWLPQVNAPLQLSEALAEVGIGELGLAGSLQTETLHPRLCFERFFEKHGRKPRSISVWIGPEGDFTRREIEQILHAGAQPITLGPLVLRTETAAAYCLSFINYEMQAPES